MWNWLVIPFMLCLGVFLGMCLSALLDGAARCAVLAQALHHCDRRQQPERSMGRERRQPQQPWSGLERRCQERRNGHDRRQGPDRRALNRSLPTQAGPQGRRRGVEGSGFLARYLSRR